MCNSGVCPYEISSGPSWGDCGKRANQVCPESYETYEEAEAAMQAAEDDADNYNDYLYEQKKERRLNNGKY